MIEVPLQSGTAVRPIAECFAPVADDLARAERIFAGELGGRPPFVQKLVAHLSHYRGKRLRPALLLLTARACGKVSHEHHVLAAVVEMIHTATLVHDDVLDHADLRRHAPTINSRWGTAGSVLLGDLLFTHAFYLASTTGSTLACRLIGEATNRLCEGELRQIGHRGNLHLTEKEYFAIIDGKTAELTSCCCRLGAIFSDAGEGVVESLARYGRALGVAFQIADDVLDLVGREDRAGKSLGTDLEQRKLTLPILRLLGQSPPDRADRLRQVLSASGNHKREQILPFLRGSDAVKYALGIADRHAAGARDELRCLPSSDCRDLLHDLTRQVVRRQA